MGSDRAVAVDPHEAKCFCTLQFFALLAANPCTDMVQHCQGL